jgi:hypothetical protein
VLPLAGFQLGISLVLLSLGQAGTDQERREMYRLSAWLPGFLMRAGGRTPPTTESIRPDRIYKSRIERRPHRRRALQSRRDDGPSVLLVWSVVLAGANFLVSGCRRAPAAHQHKALVSPSGDLRDANGRPAPG